MRALVRWIVALPLVGCGPLPIVPVGDASTPQEPDVDGAAVGTDLPPLTPGDGPTSPTPVVRFTAPSAGSMLDDAQVRIEGSAEDNQGVASVMVRVGPNQPIPAATRDGFRTFWVEGVAPVGMFEVEAIATDLEGNESEPATLQLVRPSMASDEEAPTIAIQSPEDGSTPRSPLVLVKGTASDDRSVVAIEVERNGELLMERPVETSNLFATWTRLVPLLAGEQNELTFTAIDAAGQRTAATITLTGRATSDRTPPELTVTAPADGASVATDRVTVTGAASDDAGVREVKVRVGHTPAGGSDVAYGEYVAAETEDGYATFTADVRVPGGEVVVDVLAIDLNGLSTRVTHGVTSTFVSEWSDEVTMPLRLHAATDAQPLDFTLDKGGIDEVFSEAIQRDTRVVELDTTPLITDAITKIKDSCGTRWRENNANPRHNCSGSGYGEDRSPPIPWQRSPEYSMVRVLTMTPANVVVAGTSLGELEGIANLLNVGGGFNEVLADTMGIPMTQEIVPTPSVVRGLQEYWMQSHPEVLPGAKLPISLFDAMHDLAPLAETLGPAGDHPGLIDPDFPPHSRILGDDFEMQLVAASNLRWLDGVDVSNPRGAVQKDYIALVFDTTGPSFDDVLEFDFSDPERFDVSGLIDSPRVDMRMLLRENPEFLRTCTRDDPDDDACQANLPSSPMPGYMWDIPRHQLEATIAAAAFYTYEDRKDFEETYLALSLLPAADVSVGLPPDPPGWTRFSTLLNLGAPPSPQYLWENVTEVAQVALHNFSDMTLLEGDVNLAFSLKDVDVGLTADDIREAMRPRLQEQRQKLSDRLFGDYRKTNGAVDFYYRRGADDEPYVFFVSPTDPLPGDEYAYANPGFFDDADLTQKRSTQDPGTSGDSAHEKLALAEGETTVFMADAAGDLYRLRFVVPEDPTEIQVLVSRKVR